MSKGSEQYDLRKAAEMALEALNIQTPLDHREFELRNSAIEALRQALAQPKWVGLKDEDVATVKNEFNRGALWAEQILKEKNT
jgi:hypothetical protein